MLKVPKTNINYLVYIVILYLSSIYSCQFMCKQHLSNPLLLLLLLLSLNVWIDEQPETVKRVTNVNFCTFDPSLLLLKFLKFNVVNFYDICPIYSLKIPFTASFIQFHSVNWFSAVATKAKKQIIYWFASLLCHCVLLGYFGM